MNLRNLYKDSGLACGQLSHGLSGEDLRKIERQVVNTRGELLFSKVIVLFEGETEEQALPILAEKYFGNDSINMGINFIGVGGGGGYKPFIRFAEAFNIPWFILSDGEVGTISSVKSQLSASGSAKNETDVVVFFDNGKDFEKQLLNDGFKDELVEALMTLENYANEQHRSSKELELAELGEPEILVKLKGTKTKYAPAFANIIVDSGKPLPPKIVDLFNKISAIL